MMDDARLQEIRARVAAATPGPWHWDEDNDPWLWGGPGVFVLSSEDEISVPNPNDYALIAHAPQDLADLLAEVERLQKVITLVTELYEAERLKP